MGNKILTMQMFLILKSKSKKIMKVVLLNMSQKILMIKRMKRMKEIKENLLKDLKIILEYILWVHMSQGLKSM